LTIEMFNINRYRSFKKSSEKTDMILMYHASLDYTRVQSVLHIIYVRLRNPAGTRAPQICFEKLWFEVQAIAGQLCITFWSAID